MGFAVLISPPVIAGITLTAMLGLSVRSFRLYSRRVPEFRSQLKRLDRELAKWHGGMSEKQQAVAALEHQIAPLQSKEAALHSYFEELRAIELEAEKKALARQQAEKPSRKLEITVKKKGWE